MMIDFGYILRLVVTIKKELLRAAITFSFLVNSDNRIKVLLIVVAI